jgi:hypothetical protein
MILPVATWSAANGVVVRCRFVALSGQGAPIWQLQIALRPLQRLERRLFVDATDYGFRRRIDIEADKLGGLGCKLWIVEAPGFASRQIDLVVLQEAPDILDVKVGQRLGQKRSRPSRKPFRRRHVQQLKDPLAGRLRTDRLLARSWRVAETFKPMIGKAIPPETGDPRRPADLLGDRARTPTGRCNSTIRARFKSRCSVRADRQRACSVSSSLREMRASVASGIILILNHAQGPCKAGPD